VRDEIKKKSFESRAMPYLGDLRLTSLWLTKRHPDAEELVQNSLTEAYKLWRPSLSKANCRVLLFKVLTWLFFSSDQNKPTILSTNCKRNYFSNISLGRVAAVFEESARKAARTIVRLPIEVRFVKFLSEPEGFSSIEIAEIIGLKLDSNEFITGSGFRLLQMGPFSYSGQG
jgi:DNA-directed RNA polymerase specialized sigma24 family protein